MPKLKPIRGSQLDRSHPLARGLVGCWVFDGSSGKFCDLSGNGRIMAVGGGTPKPVPGNHGWALEFDDAASEHLQRTGDDNNITDWPMSIACSFQTDQEANQALVIIGSTAGPAYYGLWIRDPADTDVIAYVMNVTSGYAKTSRSYGTNVWHHACAVFASDTDRRVFLDGGHKGTDSSAVSYPSGSTITTIGAREYYNLGKTLYLSGKLGYAFIWNRALSDAEIAAWHRQTADLFDSGPSPAVLYVPAGGQVHWASAAVQGRSAVNAKASRLRQAAAHVQSWSDLTSVIRRTRQGRAAMSGQSELEETARLTRRLGATVTVASALTPTARLTRWQKATIQAHSEITASATVEGEAAVTWASAEISAAAQISARARATVGIEACVAGQGSVAARARHQRRAAGQVQATSRIRATATLLRTFVPAWGTSRNEVIDGLIVS